MMSFLGEIRKVRPLDLLECSKIASICFEYKQEEEMTPEEYYKKKWREKEKASHCSAAYPLAMYAASYEGNIVSCVAAMPFQVYFDGNEASMCGIGGVCTLPQYRRLGSVRGIFGEIIKDEKEKGTEFSYLYPFSQSYYEKFGYYMSDPKAEYLCGLSHLKQRDSKGEILLYDGESGIDEFRRAYSRMNETNPLNLMVKRDRFDYGKVMDAKPCKKNKFAYLFYDERHEPCGYLVFHRGKEDFGLIMEVDELCYDTADTLLSIMGFVSGFAADYQAIRFEAPLSYPLEFICSDQSQGLFEKKLMKNGMMRVIDVPAVLKKARYRGSGEAVIKISDPVLNHIYHLGIKYMDGRLADITDTEREEDMELSVGLFSAAITGRYQKEDWKWIQGKSLPENLQGIFYKKDIYTNNYF